MSLSKRGDGFRFQIDVQTQAASIALDMHVLTTSPLVSVTLPQATESDYITLPQATFTPEPETTYITVTLEPETITSYISITPSPITVIETQTLPPATQTTDHYFTVTTTELNTATAIATCISVPVTYQGNAGAQQFHFAQFYAGSGFTEDPSSPVNVNAATFPPIRLYMAGSVSLCDAASQCGSAALNQEFNTTSPPSARVNYFSIDLHYLSSQAQWECVQYQGNYGTYGYGGGGDGTYFNVSNPDVSAGYGYSFAYY